MTEPPTISLSIRLAFRVEGQWWNCYIADEHSMTNALHFASIRLAAVQTQEAKEAWMTAIRVAFVSISDDTLTIIVGEPQRAPEAERSGSA